MKTLCLLIITVFVPTAASKGAFEAAVGANFCVQTSDMSDTDTSACAGHTNFISLIAGAQDDAADAVDLLDGEMAGVRTEWAADSDRSATEATVVPFTDFAEFQSGSL